VYLVVTNQSASRALVQVNGAVDVFSAAKLRGHLFALIATGHHHLVMDFEHVTFVDASGLGVLVGALKRVRGHRGSIRVVCSHERIVTVFRVTGLSDHFPIHANLEDAVAPLGRQASFARPADDPRPRTSQPTARPSASNSRIAASGHAQAPALAWDSRPAGTST
jgi:anti-sigma B factor antagonist